MENQSTVERVIGYVSLTPEQQIEVVRGLESLPISHEETIKCLLDAECMVTFSRYCNRNKTVIELTPYSMKRFLFKAFGNR